jgi:hypothetical protein
MFICLLHYCCSSDRLLHVYPQIFADWLELDDMTIHVCYMHYIYKYTFVYMFIQIGVCIMNKYIYVYIYEYLYEYEYMCCFIPPSILLQASFLRSLYPTIFTSKTEAAGDHHRYRIYTFISTNILEYMFIIFAYC